MKYNFKYKIASMNNSLSKDEKYWHVDYDYTNENLRYIFSEIKRKVKGQNNIRNSMYMEESMPDEYEIQNMVFDIVNYYKQFFELNEADDELIIKIRFFLHVEFRGENGDASETEIRISCKNLVKNIIRELNIDNIPYDKRECFRNHLRLLLAHEMFHVFHKKHYKIFQKKQKEEILWETGENICHDILAEAFADYFAYSYICHYIEEQGEMVNIKRNHVMNPYAAARAFGIGRKKYLKSFYSQKEIDKDEEEFKRHSTESMFKPNTYNVTETDYAGGYILMNVGKKKYNGKQGKENEDYKHIYNKLLNKKSEEALYDMMQLYEYFMNNL